MADINEAVRTVSCVELQRDFLRKRGESNVFTAVQPTSMEMKTGELTVLYGSSGSGKTTLLSMLSGVLRPSSGKVLYGDTSIYDLGDAERSIMRRDRLSLVPQGQTAIQSLTVMENVLLPFSIAHEKVTEEILERAKKNMELLGISSLASVYPSELSGGENRRMAFARAFTRNTEILVLDEPTADLDEKNAAIVVSLLSDYAKEHIVIAATHDSLLRDHADVSYRMEEGVIHRL